MSRLNLSERLKLSGLLAGTVLRRAAGRVVQNPFAYWPRSRTGGDRILIAPQDLRTADATRAAEIYAGRFAFAGKVVTCDSRTPFEMIAPSDEWLEALHGFGWLRHLRAAESGITRANARALVDEWLNLRRQHPAAVFRPELAARRLMSFLSQAPLILHDADLTFYRRFLRSLTRQARILRRAAFEARDGLPRLQVVTAVAYAALCLSSQSHHIRGATRRLTEEIERQILPDGGHISRNPQALLDILLDLLPLRQLYAARNIAPPAALLNGIDRMMPMLRFFRHGDGNFALFNGMGPTPQDELTTILAYDDARGAPVGHAAHAGYCRLDATDAVLLMDVGTTPALAVSHEIHAGCLSFEFSSRFNRIVVNCGQPAANRASWRQPARATAAHSTVAFHDTSSMRFLDGAATRRVLDAVPALPGPRHVEFSREDDGAAVTVRASHDGYADRFGLVHHRQLTLAADGTRLDGEDRFTPAGDGGIDANDAYVVRFHLHPLVRASRLSDRHSVMLVMPNKDVWTFDAYEHEVELEESVSLAGVDGPRRTLQLVLSGTARIMPRVRWLFVNVTPAEARARRRQQDEPELPFEP
ncbi:MAG TPA: heparinase II/III family protein [Xanthobacteraceae bacterium]|nr:heparinase II/III family protein [Xanthobacteraceae bacterium]